LCVEQFRGCATGRGLEIGGRDTRVVLDTLYTRHGRRKFTASRLARLARRSMQLGLRRRQVDGCISTSLVTRQVPGVTIKIQFRLATSGCTVETIQVRHSRWPEIHVDSPGRRGLFAPLDVRGISRQAGTRRRSQIGRLAIAGILSDAFGRGASRRTGNVSPGQDATSECRVTRRQGRTGWHVLS
jgi:hypothetical protein